MKFLYSFVLTSLIFSSSIAQTDIEFVSHYVFPEFIEGVILMNDGNKFETKLNYNSLTEEMIFENDGKKLAISGADVGLVDTVFIKDKKFIPWNTYFIESLISKDYEFFVEHRCMLKELGKPIGYGQRSRTTAITNISSIMGRDRLYDLKLPDIYNIEPIIIYWLKKNGEFTRISNMIELRKLYKNKKKLLNTFKKDNRIKYEDQEGMMRLIEFLET